MKFKHLFVSLLAVASLMATSCQDEEKDLGLPEVRISQNELSLDQGVGATNLTVYATRDWTVSTTADWISVNPQKGKAYTEAKVTVTILENEEYNRVGTVKFDIGYDSKTLTINQAGALGEKSEGTGTVDDPYTVAGVLEFIETLGTETSEQAVYIKGKVQAITLKYADSGTYGNARFTMVDEGVNDKVFTAYNVLYLGNKKWAAGQTDVVEGDEVIVCGKVYNYGGKTPETSSGAYLYSLNGETTGGDNPGSDEPKGTGTLDDPYNPAGAAAAVANLTWTSNTEYESTDNVYVKGKISRIATNGTFTEGGTYGNASFYITENGTDGTEFYAFRILYLGNQKFASGQTDIQVGDEVVIYGKLMNYRGNTPETATGAYLYSLNGTTAGGDNPGGGNDGDEAKGTGTLADPYNPAGAAAAVANLTWTSNTDYQSTDEVYVKGKISRIANNGTFTGGGTFGNASFYITENGTDGTEFYAFRVLYLGNQKYATGQTDIQVGDEVVIYGKLMNYRGNTPETVSGAAYLYSLNGKTEDGGTTGGGGDNPGGGDEAKGTGTLADPYNPAGAVAAVANLTWTSNTDYQSTAEVYVKGKISRIASKGTYTEGGTYGNASFYITENGTDGTEFYAFRVLYLGNQKFASGQTDIKVGDEVVIYGKLMNYRGDTPETVSGSAYLYSLNGKTEDDGTTGGGGTDPGTGDGGDTGNGITVALAATSFTADTDATYGAGFKYTSSEGIVIAYYKYNSSNDLVNTHTDHIRVYKNAVIVVTAPTGKTIKNLVFNCTYADKTYQMNVLEGGGATTANTTALTVTWSGSASKFVGNTVNGQCQFKNVVVTLE